MTGRRYYNPGERPQPRKPTAGKKRVAIKAERMPRAKRLALMAAHGITKPTGRQWKRLRRRLAREGRR
jgi:hypothetical protein